MVQYTHDLGFVTCRGLVGARLTEPGSLSGTHAKPPNTPNTNKPWYAAKVVCSSSNAKRQFSDGDALMPAGRVPVQVHLNLGWQLPARPVHPTRGNTEMPFTTPKRRVALLEAVTSGKETAAKACLT